jgi:hypothetical protein
MSDEVRGGQYVAMRRPHRQVGYFDDYYPEERLSLQVHVRDDAPRPTGLLDAAGVPIYRMPEVVPIGFMREREGGSQ